MKRMAPRVLIGLRGTAFGLLLLAALAVTGAHGQSAPLPPGTIDGATTAAAPAVNTQTPVPLVDAEARLAAGDYQGSLALLNPYLSAHPEDARGHFDRGYAEDAQNHTQAAEEDYRKAISLDPRQFESRLALGLLLASRSAADPAVAAEARTQLQAATELQPEPPNPGAQGQAYRALARLIYKSEPEAARQALLAALKLTPETLADTLLTAEIADAAGDPETAEQAYRGVLASAGDSAPATGEAALQATTGLAHLLIQAQKYPEAELILRRALVHNAADPVLNSQLARVLMAEDKSQEAIAVLENLHAGQPGDRNVTRMLADLDTQSGQAAKADPLYVELMNNSGSPAPDESLLAARGDNLVRQQRFKDAVLVLQQATTLDPQDGNAWSSLAFAASEDHQPKMVLDALEMRSKVMPETPATYFLAATAWDTLHQTKHAVEMYKQFLAVAAGKFPDEEWQAKHRLVALSR
jgi:tetratricopeptide (TPR) repeat protein